MTRGFPVEVRRYATLPSTMDEAKRIARAGAPHGTVVVAEEQASGRGQSGHTWSSPKGGLYLSIVLRDVGDLKLLTLALGNAVADALEVAGVDPGLKWVNDVVVGGKKVAGILVEGEATGDKLDFAVAGIGVNVNGGVDLLPADVQPVATTLERELGCESCIPDLETLLLDAVGRWVETLAAGKGSDVLAAYRQRDILNGRQVIVTRPEGKLTGIVAGIADNGHLLVKTPTGMRELDSGSTRLA